MNLNLYPSEAFKVTAQAITLRELPEDAVSSLTIDDSLSLAGAKSLATPIMSDGVEVHNDEAIYDPIFIRVNGSLEYYKDNFNTVINSGAIRVRVRKVDCADDFAYQNFYNFAGTVPAGEYTITVKTSSYGNPDVDFTGTLALDEAVDSISALADRLNEVTWLANTNDAVRAFTFVYDIEENCLKVRTVYEGGLSTTGRVWSDDAFFSTHFGKIGKSMVFCAPEEDTLVVGLITVPVEDVESDDVASYGFEVTNKYGYYSKQANNISLIHKTDGKLYLEMVSGDENYKLTRVLCPWSWTNEEFVELELDFDSSLTSFLVNGKLVSAFDTVGVGQDETDIENIIRENPKTNLKLVDGGDAYDYAGLVIFDHKQHCGSYEPSSDINGSYAGSYITYDIGETVLYNDAELSITGDGDFTVGAYDGTTPILEGYTDLNDFADAFNALPKDADFEADDLVIKVVFNTPGSSITSFTFDQGTGSEGADNPANFDSLYEWVRRKLGWPKVPVELTDDQIYDALCEAVDRYNKWRNWNENLYIGNITDNEEAKDEFIRKRVDHEGVSYIIPANIGEKDIIDIFFQPRYTAAWFGSGSDFINDVVAQTFFSRAIDMSTNAADYYIYRLSLNDISNLIGSQLSWRIYNHRIYITPNNLPLLDQFKLGIRYRESLSVEEILNSWQIKRLTLANAMITLGMIRGTFTSGIPAGDMTITLNSDMLITRGTELRNEVETELKKEQKPLFMIWS